MDTPIIGPLRRRDWADAAHDVAFSWVLVPAWVAWRIFVRGHGQH